MFFPIFVVKFVFFTAAIVFTAYKWPMKHAFRQTANLPNQSLLVPVVYLRRKVTFTPSYSYYQQICPSNPCLCLNPVKLFLYFGHSTAPNPYNYVAALVLYERGAPLGVCIGGNMSGGHYRRNSMLNSIGGARTRSFFKLTNRWRSDIL